MAVADDALAFLRAAEIINEEQIAAWKMINEAVHEKGGRIFA